MSQYEPTEHPTLTQVVPDEAMTNRRASRGRPLWVQSKKKKKKEKEKPRRLPLSSAANTLLQALSLAISAITRESCSLA